MIRIVMRLRDKHFHFYIGGITRLHYYYIIFYSIKFYSRILILIVLKDI